MKTQTGIEIEIVASTVKGKIMVCIEGETYVVTDTDAEKIAKAFMEAARKADPHKTRRPI